VFSWKWDLAALLLFVFLQSRRRYPPFSPPPILALAFTPSPTSHSSPTVPSLSPRDRMGEGRKGGGKGGEIRGRPDEVSALEVTRLRSQGMLAVAQHSIANLPAVHRTERPLNGRIEVDFKWMNQDEFHWKSRTLIYLIPVL